MVTSITKLTRNRIAVQIHFYVFCVYSTTEINSMMIYMRAKNTLNPIIISMRQRWIVQ
jgi:hypothetical protein